MSLKYRSNLTECLNGPGRQVRFRRGIAMARQFNAVGESGKENVVAVFRRVGWGIPFTDPTRNAIRPAWRVRDALLPVSTIPGPFRRWTIGFGTKQHAVITSGACAGRRALSARHASGRRPVATSRLLPRRVHFPLQSSPLKGQRPALPSARRAGRRRRPGAVSRDHWKARKSARFCGLGQ